MTVKESGPAVVALLLGISVSRADAARTPTPETPPPGRCNKSIIKHLYTEPRHPPARQYGTAETLVKSLAIFSRRLALATLGNAGVASWSSGADSDHSAW